MEDESYRESRSKTLIECLRRLPIARLNRVSVSSTAVGDDANALASTASSIAAVPSTTLTIHVVGADHREGNSGEETCAVFASFFQSLVMQDLYKTLQLVLIGPNIARLLHQTTHSHTYSSSAAATATATAASPPTTSLDATCQVELRYFVGSFDAYYADKVAYVAPDLAVCFNAGIWGYDEWLPSLALLLHTVQTPVLVTSYNKNEAIDDQDVLETLETPQSRLQWYWHAEKNPHGSLRPRATNNSIGSVLHENDYWLCVGPATHASAM